MSSSCAACACFTSLCSGVFHCRIRTRMHASVYSVVPARCSSPCSRSPSLFCLSFARARAVSPPLPLSSRFSFVCIDPGRPSHSTQVARAPRALSLTLPRAPPPLHNNHLPRTCSHIPKFRATGSHDNAVFLILYTLGTHARKHARKHARTHTHTHTRTRMHTRTHTHTQPHTHTYPHTHMLCVYTNVQMYTV